MKILPNLLTVDCDRAKFPLHSGIWDFLYNLTNLKVPKKHRDEPPAGWRKQLEANAQQDRPLVGAGVLARP